MSTTYHVLNGDCLADQLKQTQINQDFIVCRECCIEGDLIASDLSNFWSIRAKFIANNYHTTEEDYFNKSVKEFEKRNHLPENAAVCLWFENDLFCQTNMWLILSLLTQQPTLKLYRIFPVVENDADTWKGFGIADTEMLEQAYTSKVLFEPEDVDLGKSLWIAYKNNNLEELKALSKTPSSCFQHLEEVCQAHIDRFPADETLGRPEKVVREIIETTSKDFKTVFAEFSDREGIYGFSDLQVKAIYDKQILI